MREMQPAFLCLYRMRPLAILHLCNGVIVTGINYLLFLNLCVGDIIYQCPADTSAATSVDKSVLWTCVPIIFLEKLSSGLPHSFFSPVL